MTGPSTAAPRSPARGSDQHHLRLFVGDMDCASCLARIRTHLDGVDGVRRVEGSPIDRRLDIAFDAQRVGPDRIRAEVERLGYAAAPASAGEDRRSRTHRADIWTGRRARLTYASAALFGLALLLRGVGADFPIVALPMHEVRLPDVLLLLAALTGGWNFFPKGIRAARDWALDMNFLMTAAILGAVGIGHYAEAAAIAFLFSLAELMEGFSVERVRASVETLLELAPETARVERAGEEVKVPADRLVPGDVVTVRPGERVPADGRVIEGASAVDQAAVTGESMPVEKGPGDPVFAGTISRDGFLRARVERRADDSTLARIIRLVEEAEVGRTKSERFVERFARYYTPAVTLAALAAMIVPPLLWGAPFAVWFVRGLTLLVIACPCALVISTPVAVVSGVTAAARHGVLIKGGRHLEALSSVRVVAFDKTGTLTLGRPEVVEVRPTDGVAGDELLRAAADVEARSEHPLAKAIVRRAREGGWRPDPGRVADFRSIPGRGAAARLGGIEHRVGRPDLLAEDGPPPPPTGSPGEAGRTVVGVSAEGRRLGWIALADRPRPHAAEVVARLRRMGIERIVVLTGDNQETGEAVARALGADEARSALLPEGKVDAVRELEARYGSVAMVGDGVNDAPALAAATVGIAMGVAGSDAALETADVALMGDDLGRLPYLFRLSGRAGGVIRQNIFASIGVKALLAVGVPLGLVSLVFAVVVGDMGLSLAVTGNALRLAGVRE